MKLLLCLAISCLLIANTSCNNSKPFTEILKDSLTIRNSKDSQKVLEYIKFIQENYCPKDSMLPTNKILRQALTNTQIAGFRIIHKDLKNLLVEDIPNSKFIKVKVTVGDLKSFTNKSTDDSDLIVFNLCMIHSQANLDVYIIQILVLMIS